MAITATQVKELREKTGAGMMDCKKALVASDGDMDQAVENLRKAGVAKLSKKSSRVTKEGRITTLVSNGVGVVAEVLCETDFVGKNEVFAEYCEQLCARVAADYDVDGDVTEAVNANETGAIGDLVTNVGENIQINRVVRWQSDDYLACYLHMGGRIGVLVDISGECDDEYRSDLCMHIAAFSPRYLNPDEVPAEVIEKEKEIAKALPDLAGKPENIIDKIIDGKIRKWYTETCLTHQPWVRDDKMSVAKAAPNSTIKRFIRWQVGETSE